MNQNLSLTGMVLGASLSVLSCSLESMREADALGIVESTYCIGEGTYGLDLKETAIQFSDSCEFLYREHMTADQNLGNVDCNNVDDIPPEEGVFISGFYDESENFFYTNEILQMTPEVKPIWPLEEDGEGDGVMYAGLNGTKILRTQNQTYGTNISFYNSCGNLVGEVCDKDLDGKYEPCSTGDNSNRSSCEGTSLRGCE